MKHVHGIIFLFVITLYAKTNFVDSVGGVIKQYAPIVTTLERFFCEDDMPSTITVYTHQGKGSWYTNSSMNLSVSDRKTHIIAHEAAHVCLYLFMDGMNTHKKYKFIDEGFATIIEHMHQGKLDVLRKKAQYTASGYLIDHNLSVVKLQNWSKLFKLRRRAYYLAASFLLYLCDEFGGGSVQTLYDLISDLKETQDFNTSCINNFSTAVDRIEVHWFKSLSKNRFNPNPNIVSLYPVDNMTVDALSVENFFVTFTTPMAQNIFVKVHPPFSGISYQDVYWEDDYTLAIKVKGKLKPKTFYTILLGYPNQGLLRTILGNPFPLKGWTFNTK